MGALRFRSILGSIAVFFLVAAASAQESRPASAPTADEKWIANIRQVTFEGVRAGEGYFSPDGKDIIYQAIEPGCPHYQIYTRSLAGGPPKMLSVGKGMTTCAFFHPTDDMVLFASTHLDPDTYGPPPENAGRYAWNRHKSFDIFVAKRDGSNLTRLTDAPGYDAEAAFSPDGGRIVFTSERDGDTEIYTMKVDGSDVRRVTHSKGYDGGPFFSPDGKKICFRAFRDPRPGMERFAQVFIVDANGLHERQMTFNTAVNWAPYFHPDNKHLVYSTNLDGPTNFELVLMRVSDAKVCRLTFHSATDILPVFSPDGKKLMWTSSRFGSGNHLAIADFTMPPEDAFTDPYRDPEGGAAAGQHAQQPAAQPAAKPAAEPAKETVKEPVKEASEKPAAAAPAVVVQASPDRRVVERTPVVAPVSPDGVETAVDVTAAGCLSHLKLLASDALEGRGAGTKGGDLAAAYIAEDMKRIGLAPAGTNGWFHDFELTAGSEAGPDNSLTFAMGGKTMTLAAAKDFTPLAFTANKAAEKKELVFVGYGVTTSDGSWDDYKDIDVKDKIVLAFMRGTPDGAASASNDPHKGLGLFAGSRYKAFNAKNHGAAGILFVADKRQRNRDAIESLEAEGFGSRSELISAQIRRTALIEVLKAGGADFEAMEDAAIKAAAPASKGLAGVTCSLRTGVTALAAKTSNVVGLIEGTDAKLKDEIIIVGAHYDHLGLGGSGSLAEDGGKGQIHNGADDNASGTSGLLELAEYFAAKKPKRSLLFIAFSGEEEGLLGSIAWLADNKALAARAVAMVNMDMIGRYGDEGIAIDGVESAAEWKEILNAANTEKLKVAMTAGAMSGRSDHATFLGAHIPSVHFFTGAHPDYHKPTDDWEKINVKGMVQTLDYVARTIQALDARPAALAFTAPKAQKKAVSSGSGVYLGTVPSYAQEKGGVLLTGTSPGSPRGSGRTEEGRRDHQACVVRDR